MLARGLDQLCSNNIFVDFSALVVHCRQIYVVYVLRWVTCILAFE